MSCGGEQRRGGDYCQKGEGTAGIWNMEGGGNSSQRQGNVEKEDQRPYSPRGEKGMINCLSLNDEWITILLTEKKNPRDSMASAKCLL